jgi:hypothetical protein
MNYKLLVKAGIPELPHLRMLKIDDSQLDKPKAIEFFQTILHNSPQIEDLRFTGCKLSLSFMKVIQDKVKSGSKRLESLNIKRARLDNREDEKEFIKEVANIPYLKNLNINDFQREIKVGRKIIGLCKPLLHLSLQKNFISDGVLENMKDEICKSHIKSLDLSSNLLNSDSGFVIGKILRFSASLEILNLTNNNLQDAFIKVSEELL